jgi:hypothetical protein
MLENDKKNFVIAEYGKDEMNLAEFPITLLSKRHNTNCKTIEFSDSIKDKNGKIIKREWIVTGSDKFGLPLTYDNDVLVALLSLGKETDYDNPTIYFSRYKLLKILGWGTKTALSYKRIEEALARLKGVSIHAKNAFWDNERKSYITLGFGVIDNYVLFDSPPGRAKQQDTLSLSSVKLNDYLYQSIKDSYIKSLDLDIYFNLDSVIAKRLFRYLDKKRYGKEKYEINLFTLAYAHIGFEKDTYKYASLIKHKLAPAHEELMKIGFLKSVEYKPTSDGKTEKVVYMFNQSDILPLLALNESCINNFSDIGDYPIIEEPADSLVDSIELVLEPFCNTELLERLVNSGVTEGIARQLIINHPVDQIESQLTALPYRRAKEPAAVLVESIRENWAPPATYEEESKRNKEERAHKEKIKKQQTEEEKKRKTIENYLDNLSEKELCDLRQQALRQAKEEGGNLFKTIEIPEPAVRGYMFQITERKLNKNQASQNQQPVKEQAKTRKRKS